VAGWGSWRQLVLPAVTLGLFYAAFVARLTRASMLEVIRQDFVRTARAKGAPERRVVGRHALRLALLPVVSFLGPAAARILTGSIVVEQVFSVPGVGRYFVTAALNRDYTMVLGTALVYSALLVAFNLLVDLAYGWLDPRIREVA
jgi:oligopeptide transport system permease protein